MKNFLENIPHILVSDRVQATKYMDTIMSDSDIYAYRDKEGLLHVIFLSENDRKISESRSGIVVSKKTLDIMDVGKKSFVECKCRHIEFEDDFYHLISNIIDLIKQNFDVIDAVKLAINNWYHFIDQDLHVLSFEEKIGVIGELYTLYQFLKNGRSDIIQSWNGPLGAEKDFCINNIDLEVKTSCNKMKHTHKINDKAQLSPSVDKLFLISLYCDVVESKSINTVDLNIMIEKIMKLLKDNMPLYSEFLIRLQKLKINPNYLIESPILVLKDILILEINNNNVKNFIVESNNSRVLKIVYDYDFNGLESKNWEQLYESI